MFFILFRNRNNIISLVKFMLSGYCMNIFAGILYTGDTLVFLFILKNYWRYNSIFFPNFLKTTIPASYILAYGQRQLGQVCGISFVVSIRGPKDGGLWLPFMGSICGLHLWSSIRGYILLLDPSVRVSTI